MRGNIMSKMFIENLEENGISLFKISGSIDEDSSFSELDLSNKDRVIFDLEGVKSINSCGIREWINWLKTGSKTNFSFRSCPKIIVDQINMVSGFLPEKGEVESFFVPYYCDSSGSEKMVLFSREKEFTENGIHYPENIVCDESGSEMEIDIIESKYFRFLKTGE